MERLVRSFDRARPVRLTDSARASLLKEKTKIDEYEKHLSTMKRGPWKKKFKKLGEIKMINRTHRSKKRRVISTKSELAEVVKSFKRYYNIRMAEHDEYMKKKKRTDRDMERGKDDEVRVYIKKMVHKHLALGMFNKTTTPKWFMNSKVMKIFNIDIPDLQLKNEDGDIYDVLMSTQNNILVHIITAMCETISKIMKKNVLGVGINFHYITDDDEDRSQTFYENLTYNKDAVRIFEGNVDRLFDQLVDIMSNNSQDYTFSIHAIELFVVDKYETRGGCDSRIHKMAPQCFEKDDVRYQMSFESVKTTHNNCSIQTILHGLKLQGFEKHCTKYAKSIKKSCFPDKDVDGEISIHELDEIAKYMNVSLEVYMKGKIVKKIEIPDTPLIQMNLMGSHYYYISKIEIEKEPQKCKQCFKMFRCTPEEHKKFCRPNYMQRHFCKRRLIMRKSKSRCAGQMDKVLLYDLETVPIRGKHFPYACCWYVNKKYYVRYADSMDDDVMSDMIQMMLKLKGYSIVAYNGSGFDNLILMDKISKMDGVYVKNFIQTGQSILTASFEYRSEATNAKRNKQIEKERNSIIDEAMGEYGVEPSDSYVQKQMIPFMKKLDKSSVDDNTLWDLCRFTLCTLKKACRSFDVPKKYCKIDFDATRVRCWDDVVKYRDIVEPYVKNDVASMRCIMKKFMDEIWTEFRINPLKCVTLSHMSFNIWTTTFPETADIEIPDKDQYLFISKAKAGGRCYPVASQYISKVYTRIANEMKKATVDELKDYIAKHETRMNSGLDKTKRLDSDDLKKAIQNKINKYIGIKKQIELDGESIAENLNEYFIIPKHTDGKPDFSFDDLVKCGEYLKNLDVTSLYPTVMEKFEFPIGTPKWVDKHEVGDFKDHGIYTVKYEAPKKCYHARLHKKENGKLMWDMRDGEGVFAGVDLNDAVDIGYKIKPSGKALVWNKSADLFGEYIRTCFDMKSKAKIEGNKGKYQISKILMNALYGKMLQRPITRGQKFCCDEDDVFEFMQEHDVTNWTSLGNQIVLSGEKPLVLLTDSITKPAHLGVFILAYSRRWMWNIFIAIDPTIQSMIFTYSDTDSAHVRAEHIPKLKEFMGDELGELNNDYDDDGLIIREENLAPKLYCTFRYTPDDLIVCCMKAKGIRLSDSVTKKELLQPDHYMERKKEEIRYSSLKKYGLNGGKKSFVIEDHGIQADGTDLRDRRTFYATEWQGRVWKSTRFTEEIPEDEEVLIYSKPHGFQE